MLLRKQRTVDLLPYHHLCIRHVQYQLDQFTLVAQEGLLIGRDSPRGYSRVIKTPERLIRVAYLSPHRRLEAGGIAQKKVKSYAREKGSLVGNSKKSAA